MDRKRLYDILYALAARDGREAALFGDCAPLANEAFARSLAGDYFPELWFEVPLDGDPWFDLHALVEREDLDEQMVFEPETCGGAPDAFRWFASQGSSARQLALSWDISSGDLSRPAVQLLKRSDDTQMTCDFLASVGRADAADAYRAFTGKLPAGWFACYTGVFPGRSTPFLRVECIPHHEQQAAYVEAPDLLGKELRQLGLKEVGETLLQRCRVLAATPFQLEFQFDVDPSGCAGPTFSASVRFAPYFEEGSYAAFDANGAAGELMKQVQEWGLADGRWRLLDDAKYAKRVSAAGEQCLLYCFPAFLKLRWRNGCPVDAKAYLMAGMQNEVRP